MNVLKLSRASATTQPSSRCTFGLNQKILDDFFFKVDLWLWGQGHWDSHSSEIFSRCIFSIHLQNCYCLLLELLYSQTCRMLAWQEDSYRSSTFYGWEVKWLYHYYFWLPSLKYIKIVSGWSLVRSRTRSQLHVTNKQKVDCMKVTHC